MLSSKATLSVLLALLHASCDAFVVQTSRGIGLNDRSVAFHTSSLFAEESTESAFVPVEAKGESESDATLEAVEKFGKGSAKAKRGKRKGAPVSKGTTAKEAASLAPEEIFYEGPPAKTETILPTVSILTVVGIIPAAAAWSRQVWVRYKITSRRIRVTSGVGGKDMSEIVYPDIVELRSVKRLFGDGDLVVFLRDGAKFEMRNIPNFSDAVDFILNLVDKDVAEAYRTRGDVTPRPSMD